MATAMDSAVRPAAVLSIFATSPHTFLQPTADLHESFVQLAKQYFDPLAENVSKLQDARQIAGRGSKKRKRRSNVDASSTSAVKIRRLHVKGFETNQVWQQAKILLGNAAEEVERDLPLNSESGSESEAEEIGEGRRPNDRAGATGRRVHFQDEFDEAEGEGEEEEEDDDDDDDELDHDIDTDDDIGEAGVDWEYDRENVLDEEDGDGDSLDIGKETPPSDISEDEDEGSRKMKNGNSRSNASLLVKDKFGLNDGFFSIDEFNKQSQFLEQADARGEDDGAASDEEDIDWTTNPLEGGLPRIGENASNSRENDVMEDDEDDDDDEEEDGPTFGNMDLNAPEGDSDLENDFADEALDSIDDFNNTNNILYADFFTPPATTTTKKKQKNKKHDSIIGRYADGASTNGGLVNGLVNETNKAGNEENEADQDTERVISAVHRDLFDDLSDYEDDDEEAIEAAKEAGIDGVGGKKNLSTHERRQLALRAEIRALEAANVAAKPWTMTGEALAPSRPMNSLLEEDLDFERAGKPVPVVTDAVHEDIEALIKRRILAREFDEVVRRRPTDLATGSQQKRGRIDYELSDAKSSKGLADEYADEHLRKTDPNYVDPRNEALKAKHADIEKHWAALNSQLDMLCNWHYKPRPPQAAIEVRVDVPRIAMEDARPSASGDGIGESVLAPQEVYQVDKNDKRMGEVLTKGGTIVAKEEETRDQRKRRRRREKERMRKALGNSSSNVDGKAVTAANTPDKNAKETKRASKADVVGQLKRGGVKIIDKKGGLTDIEGKSLFDKSGRAGAGNLKL